ncbi:MULTISPECIES: type II toxin-antitoxin system VapB family antitoxin [unclassified Sphingomonas]|jgi:Arc/MetJ family transcription regulator|uniref:type II toxin-antitoxin system VapB family antitoxin n=1 Tax=unclassified Sphingomonas TaxID=196159 RepID=UPI000E10C43D|nr:MULTISPECIES: type II toxin-antitoxin system VapB family antitoxin [unclassified Sphingomonas]AXJ94522.1 type II toxin-antitoxin system VapB family antitoxin [Sphingomonas sp. FARSPH]
MRTNIDIDDALMAEAMEALGTTTKRDTVIESLRRSIKARRQLAALKALEGLGWEGDLDDMRTSKYLPEPE